MSALPLRRCAQLASRQALRSNVPRSALGLASTSSKLSLPLSSSSFPLALPRLQTVAIARPFSSTASAASEGAAQDDKPMDAGESNIHDILTAKFKPKILKVQDVSGGCGSFYSIVIVSSAFKGKSTLSAHRAVNEALKDVIEGIHGLQLKTMPSDD